MIEFDPILVHEWLRRSARRHPEKEALIVGPERWTYASLDAATDRLAVAMIRRGVGRHDRVLLFLENSSESVLALYAVLKAGAAFVMVNAGVKAPKLRYLLRHSGAALVLAHETRRSVVQEALEEAAPRCGVLYVGAAPDEIAADRDNLPAFRSLLEGVPAGTEGLSFPRTIDVDLATVIYTSGSTGDPKGVMSTHHNMVSAARSIIQYVGNRESDILLDVLPLSFDYGLYQVIMAFMFGGTVVLEKSFLFPHLLLQRLADEKVTGFPVVPTVVAMLLRMQDIGRYDVRTLRYLTNTGAALPPEHIRKIRSLFPDVALFSMFGLTECKRVCYLPPEQVDRKPAAVGWAMPNCETLVVDADGRPVPPGEVGELVVRGSNVMQGYWNDPETTARMYQAGRYRADVELNSGDYFRADEEGCLTFLGRRDDMIKCKGERVSPKEVEHAICTLPGVAEAAVIGVPDEVLGQAVKAFVVLLPEAPLTEQEIKRHCAALLEPFMVPQAVEIVPDLPRSAHGKIAKKQLHSSPEGGVSS